MAVEPIIRRAGFIVEGPHPLSHNRAYHKPTGLALSHNSSSEISFNEASAGGLRGGRGYTIRRLSAVNLKTIPIVTLMWAITDNQYSSLAWIDSTGWTMCQAIYKTGRITDLQLDFPLPLALQSKDGALSFSDGWRVLDLWLPGMIIVAPSPDPTPFKANRMFICPQRNWVRTRRLLAPEHIWLAWPWPRISSNESSMN